MSNWVERIGKKRLWVRLLRELISRYFIHDVARQGAALAYYLLFTAFPLLIVCSGLLGLLALDAAQIRAALAPLLPGQVLELVQVYLRHVSGVDSRAIFGSSLVLAVWFPTRAANSLVGAVRRAYCLPRPGNRLRHGLKVLLYTVFLLLTMILTVAAMSVGRRALAFVERALPLPVGLVRLWDLLRFPLMAVVMLSAVGSLYAVAQNGRRPGREILPGAFGALGAWLGLSAAYSWYVERVAEYDVVYGALGTVVALLIWLYLTAVVLIMGAELNGVLCALRRK